MRNPAHLPLELFNEVVRYAVDGRSDVKSLCNLSLVDHEWYAALSAQIYSRWLYDGDLHSTLSLWKFLRTILCSDRIASQVRTLHIRNWTFGLVYGHGRILSSEGDFELVRDALSKAGIQHWNGRSWKPSQRLTPGH